MVRPEMHLITAMKDGHLHKLPGFAALSFYVIAVTRKAGLFWTMGRF